METLYLCIYVCTYPRWKKEAEIDSVVLIQYIYICAVLPLWHIRITMNLLSYHLCVWFKSRGVNYLYQNKCSLFQWITSTSMVRSKVRLGQIKNHGRPMQWFCNWKRIGSLHWRFLNGLYLDLFKQKMNINQTFTRFCD